ncbi:putative SGNH hydrolase-type esterase domain-containing protein [Seiridium unicorne]|uniref:SGNH hydrolase-type esterase domain-containing protein n=1 Tax=Seiridium unicorne TaxID=138068 RepID=A0ABR2UIS4_9PEZI
MAKFLSVACLGLLGLCDALIIPRHQHLHGLVNSAGLVDVVNATSSEPLILKRDGNPADFSWIKRWAAVGDSFTAGIGAGSAIGSALYSEADWECSRYDRSYVKVLNRAFGSTVDNFQFVACSGDRTEDIYTQVQNMDGELDLVVMTAGGNDLCLSDMIKACVFFKSSEDDCEAVIQTAQDNLDNILGDNIKQVLEALNDKMNDDGIVIYNGYAQFFNTDNDDDCNGQDWTMIPVLGQALPLTLSRRKKFNDLVVQINSVIKSAVEDIASDSNIQYNIGFSNWDPWPYSGVSGQFCAPESTGDYPDSSQSDLQFFKPYTGDGDNSELKRRNEAGEISVPPKPWTKKDIYDSSLMKSRNPPAVALKKLDPRAPSPPNCPGDSSYISVPVPDNVGKNFHPNELGHVTIASFAAAELMDVRAKVLGVDSPECKPVDKFTCWQTTGRRAYASPDRMNENYKSFCNKDMQLTLRGEVGWIGSATYHKGTPDEHVFAVQLEASESLKGSDAIRAECLESFDRLINSCDGNDAANPMDWKFGGQWTRGNNVWEVTAMADYRPWPPVQKADGKCNGWYHGVWSSYEIYGAGFSTYDYGQQTILPNVNKCAGDSSLWKFEYLNPPSEEGYEWKVNFDDLIWVRARCFSNNKVVKAAGGWTNGCGGND